MAKRRLLPALRERMGTEGKSLNITGGRYGGVIPATRTYGMVDRAAGWDLETVVTDGYERVVWVFKAVEVIAGHASRLPFKITSGENEEVENHPLLRVMNKQANPSETGRAFRKRLSQQILLSKRGAFVEVTRNRGGQVTRLDLLPPDRVRIVPDPGGDYVDYFELTRYDGEVRNLPPERVRWIREPHPIDPFSGVTPLEAAGMSVELDHLARAYNVSFINRDGRPGGILGVDTTDLEDDELDRIEGRLRPGPYNAGHTTVIGTGPGGLSYEDTAARPRDMAYETTSEKSKKEILSAFGVPESMAGDASGRTFDNAEQEEYNFWQDPMLPHLELIASAFDGDVDEDFDCTFDTSKVEALELPARRRREEKRKEWNDGLITIKEYRAEAEYDEIDNAHTRALWISPAKAPVPGREGDEAALGLGEGGGMGGGELPPGDGDPGALPPGSGGTAAEAVAAAIEQGGVIDPDATLAETSPDGTAAAAVDQARDGNDEDPGIDLGDEAQAAVEAARLEGKALSVEPDPLPTQNTETYDPGDEEQRRVELSVAAALDALLARQAGVVAARMESPKARRGTRYWTPDGDTDERVGDAPIDTSRAVDTARWAGELQETLQPIVQPAAQESAAGLLGALASAGALTVGVGAAGSAAGSTAATAAQIAHAAAQAGVAPAMLALATAQEALESWLEERIVAIDLLMTEQDPSLPELIEAVKKEWGDRARAFSDSLAVTVSQTAVSGGREAAAAAVLPTVTTLPLGPGEATAEVVPVIDRAWTTRQDERVRASHEAAHGQLRGVGEAFEVGGHDLRYPSDPLGPPSQTRWCRCWVRYSWVEGSTFSLGVAA